MITEEEVITIVKNYLKSKEIDYLSIHDRVQRTESDEITVGKYKGEKKDTLTVCYSREGYQYDDWVFVSVDAENGEVLYIMNSHRSLEP